MRPLLEIEGLSVRAGGQPILDGVDLAVGPGEAVGLAGESGCGKTTTALAVMRLLPPGLEAAGTITLRPPGLNEPVNIMRRTERGMGLVRWRHVSLVFQGSMNALDPVQRVERQIAEAIRLHEPRARGVRERIAELLRTVGLTPAHGRAYPHQLSGGQRQRTMIALALACRPALVIADEPTTALDTIVEAQVLELLARLRRELGLALVLISHDLALLGRTCDRLAVMHAGRIVESGPAPAVLRAPRHAYTRRLLDSAAPDRRPPPASPAGEPPRLLAAHDLHVRFRGARRRVARAVDGLSLDWREGEVLGVVGESGCGKSTLARTLLGLLPAAAGTVDPAPGRALRRRVQMIFQDPYQSLNPRMRAGAIVAEPMVIHRVPKPERAARVERALADVGLDRLGDRFPHELSGGQRQRVAIAAALVLEPAGLICDEPVSMLDVSVQAQVLEVLMKLRRERSLALLLITHDLGLARTLCDRLAVMYLGRIVEHGAAAEVIERPRHPYTQALVAADPRLLAGEPPDAAAIPSGCRLHPRCPHRFAPCDSVDPPLMEAGEGHEAACLLLAERV